MIHYICSTVDTAKHKDDDEATAVQPNKNEEAEDPRNTTAFVSVAPTVAVDLSSTSLLASLAIAEFLVNNVENSLNDTETRALCKLLGAANFDEKEEEMKNLCTLKRHMEELGMILTDATSLKYIADLNEILSEINYDDEENEEEGAGDVGTPRSAGEGSDGSEDEDEAASDDGSDASAPGMNLSEDLMKSLDEFKITDSDDEFGMNKENSKSKRNCRGKSNKSRNSNGSAASRRARLRRLADTN
jgi:hypothetical protein